MTFCLTKIPENFPAANFHIPPTAMVERGRICHSIPSKIGNLAFSGGASTSNTTIRTKSNKFKLCILIKITKIQQKEVPLTVILQTPTDFKFTLA